MSLLDAMHRFPRLSLVAAGFLLTASVMLPATAAASPDQATTCNLQCVQNFGNLQVANRITSLTALSGKATNYFNARHITSGQNSFIQTDVTNNINGLNQLKSQLDSATSEQTARADVKLIYTQFRIYAVVLPRDYRLLHIDIEIYVDGKLRALQPQIQQGIDSAPPSERQQLDALFSDYRAQLDEAEAQNDAAEGQYAVLTPQVFDNDPSQYKTDFQDYVSDAQVAHNDLHIAAKDLHQIVQIIKSSGSSSGGAGATPTATSA